MLTTLSLYDYLQSIKTLIDNHTHHDVWVHAEIRAIHQKGGHYYLELAQKDEQGQILANCRATVWRYRVKILSSFEKATGQSLKAGLSVLIKVSANFHPQYGFSLSINEIDVNYTLGALAQAYIQMRQRLYDEGLINLNKALPMPFDINDVVVISPQNAAGLGDFRAEADRLAHHQICRFYYHHATFQGNHAPSELRSSINASIQHFITEHQRLPDLLVIIRGGGAVADLAYLNDYELAALVAEQPVPVWVGIGHQRDKVLLDEVAHQRFDTPSKVIAAIEHHLLSVTTLAKHTIADMKNVIKQRLEYAKAQNSKHLQNTHRKSLKLLGESKNHLNLEYYRFVDKARTFNQSQRNNVDDLFGQIKISCTYQLQHARLSTKQYLTKYQILMPRLKQLSQSCQHLRHQILMWRPEQILNKGYALVSHHNQPIYRSKQLSQGDHIYIEFADGKVYACIL